MITHLLSRTFYLEIVWKLYISALDVCPCLVSYSISLPMLYIRQNIPNSCFLPFFRFNTSNQLIHKSMTFVWTSVINAFFCAISIKDSECENKNVKFRSQRWWFICANQKWTLCRQYLFLGDNHHKVRSSKCLFSCLRFYIGMDSTWKFSLENCYNANSPERRQTL